jgi:ClpP class serine protease
MPLIDTSELMVSPKHMDWVDRALAKLDSEEFNARLDACESEVASAPMSDQAFWETASSVRPYNIVNRTLVIPIHGILLNKFPYQFGGMATGYEYIEEAVARGATDPDVDRIAMWVNSPGGLVAGCFDCADEIFALRGEKPIIAIVDEAAYSAAYALASSADKIIVARTGGVGHVGVISVHAEESARLEREGVKYTMVHYGRKKTHGRSEMPLDPEAEADMQTRVDALGEIFVATVARNRGLEEQAVRDTEAATYMPQEAIEAGLADSVGSFDGTLAAFAEGFTDYDGDEQMADKTPAAIAADNAAAVAAATAEARTTALAEGATAERARISGILDSEAAKTRPIAAKQVAHNTDMTVEAAATFLNGLQEEAKAESPADAAAVAAAAAAAAAPAAAGTPAFEAAMANGTNPELTPEGQEPAGGATMTADERALRAAGRWNEEK